MDKLPTVHLNLSSNWALMKTHRICIHLDDKQLFSDTDTLPHIRTSDPFLWGKYNSSVGFSYYFNF